MVVAVTSDPGFPVWGLRALAAVTTDLEMMTSLFMELVRTNEPTATLETGVAGSLGIFY